MLSWVLQPKFLCEQGKINCIFMRLSCRKLLLVLIQNDVEAFFVPVGIKRQ